MSVLLQLMRHKNFLCIFGSFDDVKYLWTLPFSLIIALQFYFLSKETFLSFFIAFQVVRGPFKPSSFPWFIFQFMS